MILDSFRVLLKYSYDECINNRLKQEFYILYQENALVGHQFYYYKMYPPNNILDKMVYKNMPTFLFKILTKLLKKLI